jgi:hypothetical protein
MAGPFVLWNGLRKNGLDDKPKINKSSCSERSSLFLLEPVWNLIELDFGGQPVLAQDGIESQNSIHFQRSN